MQSTGQKQRFGSEFVAFMREIVVYEFLFGPSNCPAVALYRRRLPLAEHECMRRTSYAHICALHRRSLVGGDTEPCFVLSSSSSSHAVGVFAGAVVVVAVVFSYFLLRGNVYLCRSRRPFTHARFVSRRRTSRRPTDDRPSPAFSRWLAATTKVQRAGRHRSVLGAALLRLAGPCLSVGGGDSSLRRPPPPPHSPLSVTQLAVFVLHCSALRLHARSRLVVARVYELRNWLRIVLRQLACLSSSPPIARRVILGAQLFFCRYCQCTV